MFRRLSTSAATALLSAALLAPVAARAQFTTVVAPPPRPAATAESTVAGANAAARDTAALTRLTDMKKWVDSATVALASGGPTTVATPADSTVAAAPATPREGAVRDSAAGTLAMHEGARAPDTATPLPTVALVGAMLLGGGLLLLRRRPRAAPPLRKRGE